MRRRGFSSAHARVHVHLVLVGADQAVLVGVVLFPVGLEVLVLVRHRGDLGLVQLAVAVGVVPSDNELGVRAAPAGTALTARAFALAPVLHLLLEILDKLVAVEPAAGDPLLLGKLLHLIPAEVLRGDGDIAQAFTHHIEELTRVGPAAALAASEFRAEFLRVTLTRGS
jgi:hypothetical protein